MKIEKDKVVSFHYSLSEAGGPEVESTRDSMPMAILVGHGNILNAVENAMLGKGVGDEFSVTLQPEEAYGTRNENARQKVPVKRLASKHKRLNAGTLVKLTTEKGLVDAWVIKAGKFMVELDLNHPFAGKTLVFDIVIKDIREPSSEELTHRHAHGEGGHQH